MITQEKALYDLLIASLLSTGYINQRADGPIKKIHVPYDFEKRFYLADYLNQHQLQGFVNVKEKANEFNINLPEKLQTLVNQWFHGQRKIFKKNFLNKLDFQAIIVYINLFGFRQIEGVSLPTNVSQEYLFTMCFTIGTYLNVKTIISQKQIKITDTPQLFLETVYKTSSLDSSSIANFLSKKEKNDLKASVNILQERQRKNAYV